MISLLKKAAYKHGYLLITAAWLYTISFIFINYWSYHASPLKVKNLLEERIEQTEEKFTSIIADTALLYKVVQDTAGIATGRTGDMGLFIYERDTLTTPDQLVYWNTNKIYISPDDLARSEGNFFVNNRNGDFELIKRKVFLRGKGYSVLGMIPVRWSFFMENKYLHTDFAGYPGLQKQYEISRDSLSVPVVNGTGLELFRIKVKTGKSFIAYDSVTVVLRVLAIILLLIFLHSLAVEWTLHDRFRNAFLFLVTAVVLLRLITYFFPFPFDYSKLPLFDPAVYASNFLHPSLGDLFVNAVLLFWLVNFYRTFYDHKPWFGKTISREGSQYASLVTLTLICFLLAGVITSLVRDGKISFDVTNFFSLNVYSVISFVLLCFLVLSFYYFSQILLKPVVTGRMPLYKQSIPIAVTGFTCLVAFVHEAQYPVYLWVLFWLFLYVGVMNLNRADIDRSLLRSSYFIFWVMYFTMSIAAIVIFQNREVELAQRKSIAEKLALQTDPSGENLLNIAATNFDDQFLRGKFFAVYQE